MQHLIMEHSLIYEEMRCKFATLIFALCVQSQAGLSTAQTG